MKFKTIRAFLFSAGLLLSVVAVAKLISASGNARILQNNDPLLILPFRVVFWFVSIVELYIAAVCFFSKRLILQTSLVAWIATSFLAYRSGLTFVGYHKPCPCLGNLMDALHISPQIADPAMKIILAYLLIGSYASLFWLWRQSQKQNEEGRIKNEEVRRDLGAGS